jgi:hypothetical protein
MGMPSVGAIDTLMKKWSADWAALMKKPDYLNYVWQRVDAYRSTGGHSAAVASNFEPVLGELAALTNWVAPAPHGNPFSAVVGAPPLPAGMTFASPSASAAVVTSVHTGLSPPMEAIVDFDPSPSGCCCYHRS